MTETSLPTMRASDVAIAYRKGIKLEWYDNHSNAWRDVREPQVRAWEYYAWSVVVREKPVERLTYLMAVTLDADLLGDNLSIEKAASVVTDNASNHAQSFIEVKPISEYIE